MNTYPLQSIFYTVEQTIKEYRKYAQNNISKQISDITFDQALVLMVLNTKPELTQKEIANLLYKDYASLTRMIELMVEKNYLKRSINNDDRRRFKLEITEKGLLAIKKIKPIIQTNRAISLNGISQDEIELLRNLLNKIINNCCRNNQNEI